MTPPQRLAWLDVARGYGMFLVFYGHLIERLADVRFPGALAQFKFVYSFHMPLFFVLAGYVAWRERGLLAQVHKGLLTRILPAVFFNLLLVFAWLPPSPMASPEQYSNILPTLALLVTGRPVFNILTWFLFCLFVVELIHWGVRRIARTDARRVVAILFLLGFGQWLTLHLDDFSRITGVPVHFWYADEAIVAAGFFEIGFLVRCHRDALAKIAWLQGTPARAALCAAAWLGVWLTYDLNQGPFRWVKPVAGMGPSSHGDPFWFPVTALLGTAAVVLLAMLTSRNRVAGWVGRASLIFLGLNAIFFMLDVWIARTLAVRLMAHPLNLAAAATGITLVSMALTAPVAAALRRYLPQLVGDPGKSGPWLPALDRRAPDR